MYTSTSITSILNINAKGYISVEFLSNISKSAHKVRQCVLISTDLTREQVNQ